MMQHRRWMMREIDRNPSAEVAWDRLNNAVGRMVISSKRSVSVYDLCALLASDDNRRVKLSWLERRYAELRELVEELVQSDPNEVMADNGARRIDGWRNLAELALAKYDAVLARAKPPSPTAQEPEASA